MAEKFSIATVIETDGAALSVLEFSTFLFNFRAAYVLALQTLDPLGGGFEDSLHTQRDLHSFANDVLVAHRRTSALALSQVAKTNLDAWTDLQFIDIRRENPLRVLLAGVPAALAVAVILSGGKIEVVGVVKAELPPLGTGIASIQDAFRTGQVPPTGGTPPKRSGTPLGQKPGPKPLPNKK
ncbi:hypothetical protein LZ009_05385 [Ramlibacter sp. XY19]|uniref:hypothetical protein n=1 Tax=Ramlibacter paludis TaxID=2908000 RepID=UPI0023D99817|nr:hypothetical protein [Ramlibacter paludis]MCG2592209.1 hypothetical protein [Ramlibacter paludis]